MIRTEFEKYLMNTVEYLEEIKIFMKEKYTLEKAVVESTKMELLFKNGDINIYQFEKQLTEKLTHLFPETLFVLSVTGIKNNFAMVRTFSIIYRRNGLYESRIITESYGEILEKWKTETIKLSEDYSHKAKIREQTYEKHKDITEVFRNEILELPKYRLHHVTGMINT